MPRCKALTKEEFEKAKLWRKAGWSYEAIGKRFGISKVAVLKYFTGKTVFKDEQIDTIHGISE